MGVLEATAGIRGTSRGIRSMGETLRYLVQASRATGIGLLVILLLLACGPDGPTDTPSPPPTPIRVELHQLAREFRDNQLVAKQIYEGNEVTIQGIQLSVSEGRGVYGVVIETGLADMPTTVLCVTEFFPDSNNGMPSVAIGQFKVDGPDAFVLEDCYHTYEGNVIEKVINHTGQRPWTDEISDACAIMERAGFRNVADNHVLNDEELELLVEAAQSFPDSAMTRSAIFNIVYEEGRDAESWCESWR